MGLSYVSKWNMRMVSTRNSAPVGHQAPFQLSALAGGPLPRWHTTRAGRTSWHGHGQVKALRLSYWYKYHCLCCFFTFFHVFMFLLISCCFRKRLKNKQVVYFSESPLPLSTIAQHWYAEMLCLFSLILRWKAGHEDSALFTSSTCPCFVRMLLIWCES